MKIPHRGSKAGVERASRYPPMNALATWRAQPQMITKLSRSKLQDSPSRLGALATARHLDLARLSEGCLQADLCVTLGLRP